MKTDDASYRLIFENAVMGIFYSTPDGKHLLANPALATIYGYDCTETLYSELQDIAKQLYVDKGRRRQFLEALERDGELENFESRIYRRDGSVIWISENARASRRKDGSIEYYVGTVKEITGRKAAEAQLLTYQDELRSLAAQLSLSEEKERRRISTELHDSIAQILALMKMKLGALEQHSARSVWAPEVTEIRQLTESAIAATRSLMVEISPPLLYEMGFEAAVGWLAEHFTERYGLRIDFSEDEAPKPLSEELKVLLFQAVRELLMNIVKHAQAQSAHLALKRDGACLSVTVSDDGIGFDETALHHAGDVLSGFGLFNIRERLRHSGGRMSIDTAPSTGTQIRLWAPLKEAGLE